jgi:hypothetical protein
LANLTYGWVGVDRVVGGFVYVTFLFYRHFHFQVKRLVPRLI